MVTRPEAIEVHRKKHEELHKRMWQIHNDVRVLEALNPAYLEGIKSPEKDKTATQSLENQIKGYIKEHERQIKVQIDLDKAIRQCADNQLRKNQIHQKFVQNHGLMLGKNEALEANIKKLETLIQNRVKEPAVLEGLKKQLMTTIENVSSIEEANKYIPMYKRLLLPAVQKNVVAKGEENIAREFIKRFKEAGDLSEQNIVVKEIVSRFNEEEKDRIIKMATTELEAEKERAKQDLLGEHDTKVNQLKTNKTLKLVFDGRDDKGRRVTAFEGGDGGVLVTDGSANRVSQRELKKELKGLPIEKPKESDMDDILAKLDQITKGLVPEKEVVVPPKPIDKTPAIEEKEPEKEVVPQPKPIAETPTIEEKEPAAAKKDLYERITKWVGKADDRFMGNIMAKPPDEAHEMLDALDAIDIDPKYSKGIKDFTKRVGERDWKEVLEVARATNKLRSNPARLKAFLDQAVKVDFDATLAMVRRIQLNEL